jgi:hypothetical protein
MQALKTHMPYMCALCVVVAATVAVVAAAGRVLP